MDSREKERAEVRDWLLTVVLGFGPIFVGFVQFFVATLYWYPHPHEIRMAMLTVHGAVMFMLVIFGTGWIVWREILRHEVRKAFSED